MQAMDKKHFAQCMTGACPETGIDFDKYWVLLKAQLASHGIPESRVQPYCNVTVIQKWKQHSKKGWPLHLAWYYKFLLKTLQHTDVNVSPCPTSSFVVHTAKHVHRI